MSVLVSTDFSVWKCEEKIYTKFAFSSIIKRYNKDLGTLSLFCPVKTVPIPPEGFIDITSLVETLIPAKKLDALLHKRNKELERVIEKSDIVLCRFPGFISMFAASMADKIGTPRFSEVMGCGWDAYWNHGILGKILAPYVLIETRKALKKSDYALYVTEEFLQNRYPCDKPSVGVSDVVIPDIEDDVIKKRKEKIKKIDFSNITLMTCAAVNVWYKGQHFVIKSIPNLNKRGIRVKYYCVGQGEQDYLKKVAKEYGVEDQVIFTGSVSHDRIFELLDECDIYVQPSLQEGLPRALVEALSRGCPSIGAKTGGIPELIPSECVVKRKSVSNISDKILNMIEKGLDEYSEKSFQRARDFQEKVLDERRNNYFEYIKTNIN
ncbi:MULTISPECIES: glycosyltransferase [Enterococcus]|uniref:glycosyltransferase n=1 Tax=Enterococcus TaxID=1350 RepID=UPI0023A95C3B|nr:glycosyltransferase [Enterococcus faecium]MDE5173771.1 glycosyltransferase [Enterococcus faecium]